MAVFFAINFRLTCLSMNSTLAIVASQQKQAFRSPPERWPSAPHTSLTGLVTASLLPELAMWEDEAHDLVLVT